MKKQIIFTVKQIQISCIFLHEIRISEFCQMFSQHLIRLYYLIGKCNKVLFLNYYEESLVLLKVFIFFPTKPSSKWLFIIFYLTHVVLSLCWFDLCIFYFEYNRKLQCTGIRENFIKQVYFNVGFISWITISGWWEVYYFITAAAAKPKMFWAAKERKISQVHTNNKHQYWRIKLEEILLT